MLHQLLNTATSDIAASCTLTAAEISRIPAELRSILSKVQFALRMKLDVPLSALCGVLEQAAASAAVAEQSAKQIAANEDLLALFLDLLSEGLHSAADVSKTQLLNISQKLFMSLQLKEKCCAKALPWLLELFEKGDDSVEVPRAAASTLICLLSGSKGNKKLVGGSCEHIANALTRSSDFFFQVQCAEILFRIHTHNAAVLAQASIPAQLLDGIRRLPNDVNLFAEMQRAVQAFNTSSKRPDMMSYDVLGVVWGPVDVCGGTTLHFSKSALMFFLSPKDTHIVGDQVTILFSQIRSVKIAKDHKLCIKLQYPPDRLQQLVHPQVDDAVDSLEFAVTQRTLSELMSSPVHNWILESKKARNQPAERPTAAAAAKLPVKRPRAADDHARQMSERSANVSFAHGKDDEEDVMEQLRHAVKDKVARQQAGHREAIRKLVDQAQRAVDDMKAANARERDLFEVEMRSNVDSIRLADASQKEEIRLAVDKLNEELGRVQAVGDAIQAEIGSCEMLLGHSMDAALQAELKHLTALKTRVDEDVKKMEEVLANLISAANPLRFLASYLSNAEK